jgi:AbrB family looped-hinge helix DNA binding protein
MRKEQFEVPELTRASSKGQIVIPTNVRKKLSIKEGTVFAVASKKDMIVLKKLDAKMNAEDLRTLKLLEDAWEDIEKGRYKVYSKEAFFKELKKW